LTRKRADGPLVVEGHFASQRSRNDREGDDFHFTFPAVGCVEKDGNGYRLIPSARNPTI
jgi:hypothetical protein